LLDAGGFLVVEGDFNFDCFVEEIGKFGFDTAAQCVEVGGFCAGRCDLISDKVWIKFRNLIFEYFERVRVGWWFSGHWVLQLSIM
jgi:hypothetical protein